MSDNNAGSGSDSQSKKKKICTLILILVAAAIIILCIWYFVLRNRGDPTTPTVGAGATLVGHGARVSPLVAELEGASEAKSEAMGSHLHHRALAT